jgi:hypothetical protein
VHLARPRQLTVDDVHGLGHRLPFFIEGA